MAVALTIPPPSQSTSALSSWHDAMLGSANSRSPLPSSSFAGSWAPCTSSNGSQPPNPSSTTSLQNNSQISNSGAVAAARAASLHGKLRKRANSASSANNGKNTQPGTRPTFGFTRTQTPPVTYEEPSVRTAPSSPSRAIPKDKIKPYLRKLSQREQNHDELDLSRSAAENDGLIGLGPYTDIWSTAELPYPPSQTFRGHGRSTSYQSQSSAASGSFRPTAPFTLPMHHSPQPYTPITINSYNNSVIGSEYSGDASTQAALADEEDAIHRALRLHQLSGSKLHMSDNLTPLRGNTSESFRRLATTSQSNLSITSSTRPRGYTNRSYDTASPVSQTSFDKALSFVRSKDEPMNPATRQASIQAARQAFTEREEAKARRYEKQEQKAAERRNRKKSKQEAQRSRSLVPIFQSQETRPAKGKGNPFQAGREYADLPPERTNSLPILTNKPLPARTLRETNDVCRKKDTKSRYLRAVTWLKMKTLDIGKTSKAQL